MGNQVAGKSPRWFRASRRMTQPSARASLSLPRMARCFWADAECRRRKQRPASPCQGAPTQQWVPCVGMASRSAAGSTVSRGPWKAQPGLGQGHVGLDMGKTVSSRQPRCPSPCNCSSKDLPIHYGKRPAEQWTPSPSGDAPSTPELHRGILPLLLSLAGLLGCLGPPRRGQKEPGVQAHKLWQHCDLQPQGPCCQAQAGTPLADAPCCPLSRPLKSLGYQNATGLGRTGAGEEEKTHQCL